MELHFVPSDTGLQDGKNWPALPKADVAVFAKILSVRNMPPLTVPTNALESTLAFSIVKDEIAPATVGETIPSVKIDSSFIKLGPIDDHGGVYNASICVIEMMMNMTHFHIIVFIYDP
jgi:hypothetical protein